MVKAKPFGPLSFYLLSVLVGVVAGLGAVAFRGQPHSRYCSVLTNCHLGLEAGLRIVP
jgi:hypothetical protein